VTIQIGNLGLTRFCQIQREIALRRRTDCNIILIKTVNCYSTGLKEVGISILKQRLKMVKKDCALHILSISITISSERSGRGYLTKFNTGRLRPKVQPLTLLDIIFAENVPL